MPAMPVKFEWQTDEEREWTDEAEPVGQTASWRRHWRIWLALFWLLAVVIGISYALLNRRATAVENAMAGDVLAGHRLVQQAIANRDAELFAVMLFPFDRQWDEVQRQLFDRQLFLDRVPLGLWAAPQLSESEPVVAMAPDLQTAVVTTQIPTIIEVGETVTQTVVLEHTAVYQRDDSQWFLAPIPDESSFWGRTITEKGRLLTLSYPARDAEIGRRLVVDLDRKLEELCQLEGAGCPPSFKLRLSLGTDDERLLALEINYQKIIPRRVSGGALRLALPAPTLVGRPVDEAGYQALLKGYAGWVTAVLLTDFNRAQPPVQVPIAYQLAQIGLRPPPLHWERPWQPHPPPPIPLPEQDIVMLCQPNNQRPFIWRYDLSGAAWIDETPAFAFPDNFDRSWSFLLPMPDDAGFLLVVNPFDDTGENGRLFLWQDGAVSPLPAAPRRYAWLPLLLFMPTMQQDRYLFFAEDFFNPAADAPLYWLDLSSCPGDACQFQTGKDGLPLWSPDEGRTILLRFVQDAPPELALGDAAGRETAVIGPGWSPIWVDDSRFVYLRPAADAPLDSMQAELVEVVIDGTAVTENIMLDSETLRQSLAEQALYAIAAWPSPTRPGQWFIHATSPRNTYRRNYMLSFVESDEKATLLFSLDDGQGYPAQLVGNGRYLSIFTAQTYQLYALESGQTTSYDLPASGFFPLVDWSANGQWLVLVGEGMIRLVAPGARYEQPIFYGIEGCGTAVWVNQTK